MKRRFALLGAALMIAGSIQMAPVASASEICADPNCPWSPITGYVRYLINRVDEICDESTTFGCPL